VVVVVVVVVVVTIVPLLHDTTCTMIHSTLM
jgi:hypothetical protein